MADARDKPSAGAGTPSEEAVPSSAQPTGQTEAPKSQSSQTDVGSAGPESPTTLEERALALPPRQVVLGALISTGALALGSIGPWATATVFGVSVSAGGLHGGGWVTLVTAAAGFIALFDPQWASRAGWSIGTGSGLAGPALDQRRGLHPQLLQRREVRTVGCRPPRVGAVSGVHRRSGRTRGGLGSSSPGTTNDIAVSLFVGRTTTAMVL
jgi:hypothetical protein